MNRAVTTTIDPERCNGCGLCVAVCPLGTLSLRNGLATVSGSESLNCGHCAAVCPQGAVHVGAVDPRLSKFSTFKTHESWIPYGDFDTGTLVRLMRSRRSCRNFRSTPVERPILEDLVKIGITAPSGSNAQLWSFTILPDRESVVQFGMQIGNSIKKFNRLAEKAWLRFLLKCIGKPMLADYYASHYPSVQTALEQWERYSRDMLFHGAPGLIVVGSRNDASCPAEDALLAAQNILLAAHCMGLGTCLVGYAVEVMRQDPRLNRWLGLPQNETPYAVIALGYPDESYVSVAGRCRVALRYVHKSATNRGCVHYG